MDIEAIVNRAYTSWAYGKGTAWTDHLRAALTEQAEAYEERIRQMEAERVPEGNAVYQLECKMRGYTYWIDCDQKAYETEKEAGGPCRVMYAAAPRRCHLCDYQHGHKIGCVNNPVDIALRSVAAAKEGSDAS